MKVPPKRKGNFHVGSHEIQDYDALNESPSEKEGKYPDAVTVYDGDAPSMKVPPKRKGNLTTTARYFAYFSPQ